MQPNEEMIRLNKPGTPGTDTPTETDIKGKVIKKSGKRIGYNYIILKSLKESQKNDVVKCLYIKSLVDFGICVIKEGTYGDSKDKEGRDITDRLIWQKQLHQQLQHKVRLPKYLGSFEENGNYYLVIERIKGKSLHRVCRQNGIKAREGLIYGDKTGMLFLDYLIQLTALLESLHDNHIVHRDVSVNNFMITPGGKLAIIDMELSYSLEKQFPSPPFQLGTHGYMSPQQENQQHPSMADDIFSVGAIMLQMWTGVSPVKMTKGPLEELSKKVQFFVPDAGIAGIIIQCLEPDAGKRPSLPAVRRVLEQYRNDLRSKNSRPSSMSYRYEDRDIIAAVQRAVYTLATPLLADPERGWISEDPTAVPLDDKRKINKGWYASFDKGAAGVLYTLACAKRCGLDISGNEPYVQKALELIDKKYISRIQQVSPSLHFGASGIAASLSKAICEEVFQPQPMHFEWIDQLISADNSENDFLNGIAGQGMAHWPCFAFLNEKKAGERLAGYVNRLIASQQKNGCWMHFSGKKKKVTKGFFRGSAGIICFLLEYALQCQEREPLEAARRGLNWLAKTAVHQGDSLQWRSSSGKKIAHWWNEGAPGIALAFLKAYAMTGDALYKKYATGALLTNPPQIIDNDLSQREGLSGLGEIYLEAWEVLKEPVWLERAKWITQVLMHLKKEHKYYGPYWLARHEKQPVTDFMNGDSGVIHFLLRYCHQDLIGFPLFHHKQTGR